MGRGGGLEAKAGAIAVRGVAAVVEDGEQVAAVLDSEAARIAGGGLRVVAGQVAAGAELVVGGGRGGGGARDWRLRARAAS